MSENWKILYSWKGVNAGGVEVLINVRADSDNEFAKLRQLVSSDVAGLKPVPVRPWGGGAGKPTKKEIVYLPDAPKCPTHPLSVPAFFRVTNTPTVNDNSSSV